MYMHINMFRVMYDGDDITIQPTKINHIHTYLTRSIWVGTYVFRLNNKSKTKTDQIKIVIRCVVEEGALYCYRSRCQPSVMQFTS